MGKSLIIKGADFSSVAVDRLLPDIQIVITPSWVNGKRVSNKGSVFDSKNHKYALISLPEKVIIIQSRIAISAYNGKDLIFMNGEEVVSIYPENTSSSSDVGNLFIANIPSSATAVYVNYMTDSRASELGFPILSDITFTQKMTRLYKQ